MSRLGIYTIVTPHGHTGVGRQLYGLLAGLQQVDAANEYLLYCQSPPALPLHQANFRPFPLPVTARSRLTNHFFELAVLPFLAVRHRLHLLHIPNAMPVLFSPRPTVVTIYDLAEFALPQRVYQRGRHAYRRLANRLAARRATAVITTSSNTGSDLVHFLGLDPTRVHVIYPGIDHEQFRPQPLPPARRAHLQQTYGLPGRFLLYVGKIQPRKNLARLLRAFSRLRPTHPDLHLVLAGARGWMYQEIDALLEELEMADRVHQTGFVAEADLPALYNLAEMLVFPSLYEGFGFPLVEAMACGLPVVTAATSSLGEIAGDAALCVDPTAVDEIVAAIDTCLRDGALRATLRQKGLVRARNFNWSRCAQETLACYETTLAKALPRLSAS